MPAVLLDGRARRDEILESLRAEVEACGRPRITFATVLVGDDEASARYVALKHRAAERIGVAVRGVHLPGAVTQERLHAELRALSADPSVHGILLQLPLPEGLDEQDGASFIEPTKDVDGMTAFSLGRLVQGAPGHRPCTAAGVCDLLRRHQIPLAQRRAVVVGRGPLVALPLALMLAAPEGAGGQGCAAVTVVDPDAEGVAESCRAADLVVSDARRPQLVRAAWIKPGATVVDVGVSFVDGRLTGDVHPEVLEVAGAVVPN
ncbi:MAG: bifunctional 5,10-methylenetetrahydrofolate dehydrogenase/5,10-methenyltetrahydrofolate cyclohydrolase, partial [Acidimicrobiales bacterium]